MELLDIVLEGRGAVTNCPRSHERDDRLITSVLSRQPETAPDSHQSADWASVCPMQGTYHGRNHKPYTHRLDNDNLPCRVPSGLCYRYPLSAKIYCNEGNGNLSTTSAGASKETGAFWNSYLLSAACHHRSCAEAVTTSLSIDLTTFLSVKKIELSQSISVQHESYCVSILLAVCSYSQLAV